MFFRGLINNGCTCYVNASLQSLFHCDVAKNFILETHQDKKEHQRQTESETQLKNIESTVITALQQLFYSMQYSIKYYLGTKRFCKALGMSDTDMLEQKDANELIKNVLDRLEQHCQQIKDERIRFNKIFVGTFRGMITCQKCKNSSITAEHFTDLIIPTQDDFWTGLTYILWPQHLEGYFCTQCQSKQNAQKRIIIEDIPELLQVTLQRFKYDQYGYLHKDDSMIHMPLFIDLFILNTVDIYEYCQFKKIQLFKQLLQTIMQPWNYIRLEDNVMNVDPSLSKTVRQSFQQLINNDKISEYLLQYYSNPQLVDPFDSVSCDVQQSFSTNNDSLFMMTTNSSDIYNIEQQPQFTQDHIPPHYYQLTSISCHSGSLNQGHYYNLCIKQMVNDPQKFVMFNCNDTYIQAINNPQEMLYKISGKDDNLEISSANLTIKEKQNNRQNQSNTGYMYFYERLCNKSGNAVKDLKQLCKSSHLINMILSENAQIEKEIYTINVRIYSNYNEETQVCDIFGTKEFIEFDFDLRGTTQELIQQYLRNLKHTDAKTKKKLATYTICVHQCEQNTNKRTQLLTETIDDKTSLESCLFSQFNNLNYTKNFKKQLGKEQKKQITLFVEIIMDIQLKFEYQYVYVWLCKVQIAKQDELFCDNVIGYQKQLKLLSKTTYKLDKQKLVEQFYKSQFYNRTLCNSDQQSKQQISIDSRQLLCEIMLLKLAICNVDSQASIDHILIYKKDPIQQQIQLCNLLNQPQSDMTALVTLYNQDEIFYETLNIKLGNQILYQQPKLSDFQKLKSKILQTIEKEQLIMVRIYNSQFIVIKQQLVSEICNISTLVQKSAEYLVNNGFTDEVKQEKKRLNHSKIKVCILLKSKEGFKTLEFPKEDVSIKELLQYVFVQNKLQVQPQNLNIIYFLSLEEFNQFNQPKKQVSIVKRPNQQEKQISNNINMKIINQRTGVQKEYQFEYKQSITEMFQQIRDVFNYQTELIKTNPRGRLKPDLIFVESLLRYNGNLTIQEFVEIYFQLKYNVYSFMVFKKASVKFATLKIIVQKAQQELQLTINKNKIDKQCVIQNGKNWGELIQSQYKNINFSKYLFFVYSNENNYIFFDYNEIKDPMDTEIQLNFTGNYTLLIDEKSDFVVKYEDYWKRQYDNNHYYYYATVYYSGQYGRVRIFKKQTVKDLLTFIEDTFNSKVNVYIITNKRHQLKDNQDLISKIEYGLFICV